MLILLRGLPGAGKSSLASSFADAHVVSADSFFTSPAGEYNFNPSLLPQAHSWCQEQARSLLALGANVVVANTFSQRWEMEPYFKIAAGLGVRVTVADLFDAGLDDEELAERGLHGVSLETIAAMRSRWEHNWREGDPRAPWERG